MSDCPICKGRYYKVNESNKCCDLHQNWFVTTCSECHRWCFSDVINICPRCLQLSSKITCGGFSRNRRALLRKYGQE